MQRFDRSAEAATGRAIGARSASLTHGKAVRTVKHNVYVTQQNLHRFHARDVHLVMGPSRPEIAIQFRVTIDGQPPGAAHGLDVDEGGTGTVREQRLYQLARQPKPIVDRTFAIDFLDAGVETFSFTFG